MKFCFVLSLLLAASGLSGTSFASAAQDSPQRSPLQEESLSLFKQLVEFRTAAGHDQVLPMAQLLANSFEQGGFASDDVKVLPMEDTAALVVRYRGAAESTLKPILFMGHMDVVDALRKDWQRDPFSLIEEDGYFYGRGTLDNKAGIVNLTRVFLRLKKEAYLPNRDLILAFTGDEETTGNTIKALLKEQRDLVDAEFALNSDGWGGYLNELGESTSFNIQMSEKTYMTFTLETKNPGGHSSAPRADNAIYQLAAALQGLAAHQFPVRQDETTQLFFERNAKLQSGTLAKAMRRFAADKNDRWAAGELAKHARYVGVTRTTCVATMLEGGHAENALPQSAKATANCRVWPDETTQFVQEQLELAINDSGVTVTLTESYSASPASPLKPELFAAIESIVHKRHPNIPLIPYMAPFFTDGKFTRCEGIPTYGVGGLFLAPDDQRAHGLDERVPVWSFFEAQEYWYDLIKVLSK